MLPTLDPARPVLVEAPVRRLCGLDMARGVALIAMVVYHLGWDISVLGLGATGLRDNPLWQGFGHLIAASFLMLAGVSLVLAHGKGLRLAAFLVRLALVAGGAALVTLVTYYVFPQAYIFFGILHLIALGSVLALPLLRAPLVLVVLMAGALFALPMLLSVEALGGAGWLWLGLGPELPTSQDYVPLFPWFGFMLLGILLARLAPLAALDSRLPPRERLVWLGRHSLILYLVHQPVLYGGLWLLAQGLAAPVDPEQRGFLDACRRECTVNGGTPARCDAICSCAVSALREEKLWSEVIANRITEDVRARMDRISRACVTRAP